MKKITDFFWFCSGAHVGTLKKYPTEQNKHVGIGATIFFTALFASLSGGYAMYFVFAGNPLAPVFAIFFGLIWGLAIFNMDRYIVASINKSGSTNQQILQATPRILLAIMIGIVISRPLELKIFDKEIKEKLKTSYLNGQRSKIDTLNKTFSKKYAVEFAKMAELRAQRDSAAATIKADRQKLNYEIFGNKTTETSGIQGYGPYAKRKEAELKQREADLDTLRTAIGKMEAFFNEKKEFDGLAQQKMFSGKQLDSLANVAGFADRNWALGQLSFKENGDRDLDNWLAISFIGFLFILFECLPVFVKLMSSKGPYDYAIENTETSVVHQSYKERDYDIAVADGTQDTKVESEVEKQNYIVRGQSKYDADNYQWKPAE